MAEIIFIGVPYWLGEAEGHSGSVLMVKESGILAETGAEWVDIQAQYREGERPTNGVGRVLAAAVKEAVSAGKTPIVLAGDCTYCLGMMKGLEEFSPDVLWIDAHGDFNTLETTPSNFLGGMPLAAMVGRDNQDLVEGIGLSPVPENKVFITDGRDLDPGEAILVRESAVTHWQTLAGVQSEAWDNRPLYVHFDGDVLRLEDSPAVSYPAEGGPSVQEAIEALQHVIQQADVKAVYFTLWNDALDGAEKSRTSNLAVIRAVVEALRG